MKNDDLKSAYQKYYQPLFLYALSLARNKADAEDLVANTFVKALLSYEQGHLKAWLFTVLKNEYLRLYQKKKRYIDENSFDFSLVSDPSDIIKTFIAEEQKQWIYSQIYQLPSREQEIMLLSLQAELNDQEIADLMHLSVEHVRVIRYRVKKQLKDICQKEGIL